MQTTHTALPKIDRCMNLNLTILDFDGAEQKVFVPQPSRVAFDSIARILQVFYKQIVEGVPADVIVADYALFVKDVCKDDEAEFAKVQSFIDKTLVGATIFTSLGEFVAYAECKWDDELKATLEGTLLFTLALCRYVAPHARMKVLKDLITSQDCLAWKKQCESLYKGRKEATEGVKEV